MNNILLEYNLHEYYTVDTTTVAGLPSPITRPFDTQPNLLGCSVSLFVSCPQLVNGHYSVFLNNIFYANVDVVDKYTILGAEPAIKFPK